MNIFSDPKARAKFVFGQEMKACPKCGGYNIKNQTPIKLKELIQPTDGAKQILGKWTRTVMAGNTPLEGTAFIMCFTCGHKGPSVDCSGRTSEDVGKDPVVAAEMKRLWNNQ